MAFKTVWLADGTEIRVSERMIAADKAGRYLPEPPSSEPTTAPKVVTPRKSKAVTRRAPARQ